MEVVRQDCVKSQLYRTQKPLEMFQSSDLGKKKHIQGDPPGGNEILKAVSLEMTDSQSSAHI